MISLSSSHIHSINFSQTLIDIPLFSRIPKLFFSKDALSFNLLPKPLPFCTFQFSFSGCRYMFPKHSYPPSPKYPCFFQLLPHILEGGRIRCSGNGGKLHLLLQLDYGSPGLREPCTIHRLEDCSY